MQCPVCNSQEVKVVHWIQYDEYQPECDSCCHEGDRFDSEEEAIESWK